MDRIFDFDLKDFLKNEAEVRKLWDDSQILGFENSQIKSDVDAARISFWESNQGKNFPALEQHFNWRQLYFSFQEAIRNFNQIKVNKLKIDRLKDLIGKVEYKAENYKDWIFPEIEIDTLTLANQTSVMELRDLVSKIDLYVRIHREIIKKNDGKMYTNEQIQKEFSEFYDNLVVNNITQDLVQAKMGIQKGTVNAYMKVSQKPILPGIEKANLPPLGLENLAQEILLREVDVQQSLNIALNIFSNISSRLGIDTEENILAITSLREKFSPKGIKEAKEKANLERKMLEESSSSLKIRGLI